MTHSCCLILWYRPPVVWSYAQTCRYAPTTGLLAILDSWQHLNFVISSNLCIDRARNAKCFVPKQTTVGKSKGIVSCVPVQLLVVCLCCKCVIFCDRYTNILQYFEDFYLQNKLRFQLFSTSIIFVIQDWVFVPKIYRSPLVIEWQSIDSQVNLFSYTV